MTRFVSKQYYFADLAHNYAIMFTLREHKRVVKERAHAKGGDTIPTPNARIVWVLRGISGELALQQ